jgi:hypothetical protein
LVALCGGAIDARAQAWVPPAGAASITFVTQVIDHSGHLLDDGSLVPDGKSTTVALDVVFDYAFTDRFSITASLPYIFAKYRGPGPPPPFIPFLPVDSCFCVHSGWQDFSFTTRYNVVSQRRGFSLTPSVSFGVPSHDYNYVGEAVIGRRLKEARIAVDAGHRLSAISPRLSVQGQYSYAFVEKVLDLPNDRSNGAVDVDFALTRRLSVRGMMTAQRTHGGLRFPAEVSPFPERIAEHDRLLRDDNVRVGGGLSYSWRHWDVSTTYIGYTRGRNTHDIRALTVAMGWVF